MRINIQEMLKTVGTTAAKHLPGVLTAVGIGGMLTSIIYAVRATPKAMECIENEKKHAGKDALNPYDVLKAAWKCYIPTAVLASMSTVCLIGGQHVNARRNAALATAYTLSDQAFREYQKKVVETVGDKKEEKIRADVAQDRVNRECIKTAPVIVTGRGQTLCYDTISGRKFYSDIENLRRCVNNLNERMVNYRRDYISLNDWYEEIGLDTVDPLGDDLGWSLDQNGCIDLEFDSVLIEGMPCLSVGYRVMPKYGYR